MTLPTLTAPVSAPVFLAEGHGIEEDPVFTDVQVASGHARRRRVFTVAERVVSVRWLLEAAQMAAVDDWFENTLQAGALSWSAQVANQAGPGLVWWEARWLAPPQFEMLHLGRGLVSGQLFLVGEPSEAGPETGVLRAEMLARLLDVRGNVSVPKVLAMEVLAALEQPQVLRMEIEAALLNVNPEQLLDGGDFERIWVRLARTPVPGDEINRSDQELLQRAWVRW